FHPSYIGQWPSCGPTPASKSAFGENSGCGCDRS
ncbi:unnamed protein product, partial [Allacma fusca]